MSKHARLSASAAHRWLICPGSVAANDGPRSSSQYAAEGTFAHDLAARCLKNGVDAKTVIGCKGTVDGFDFTCDAEMAGHIQVYLDVVREACAEWATLHIEMPLLEPLRRIDADLGGTADAVVYAPDSGVLTVFDFKYGSGTYVEARDNPQLKLYALGALLAVQKNEAAPRIVRTVIVQPRYEGAQPIRTYEFPVVEVLAFLDQLVAAADATRQENPPRVAGDHCGFCAARRTCPELTSAQTALMAAKMPLPEAYDKMALAKALVDIPLVKERIKALEEFAYQEAMKGAEIPGFKLVDKRPTRRWKSEGQVAEFAQAQGVDPWAERVVLSPAQLEKRFAEGKGRGAAKQAKEQLAAFTESTSSGCVLVPVTDDRPPTTRAIGASDFAALPAPTNV